MEWIFTLFVTREWRQWSLLLEWISSEPNEISLVEKWIFTLLELESSEIHSSTSEISSLHKWSELFTRFFFWRIHLHVCEEAYNISLICKRFILHEIIMQMSSDIRIHIYLQSCMSQGLPAEHRKKNVTYVLVYFSFLHTLQSDSLRK